ncbi:MAG: hypothetical protein HGB26_07275, partial [Desulfobulbaceae bacterium]|nr:hypothetical protein [Desulfobulbaceae bacterium]
EIDFAGIAKEIQEMPDLLELVNYSLVNYRSILCGKITESMVDIPFDSVNEANKELFNVVSLGLPVREEDVRKTGSHSAMNLLLLDALIKRLDEFMIREIPAKLTGETAADMPRGRKVKLLPEVFESEIFPILDKEFPSGGTNDGIKKRCAEIGERYGVSESTIKNRFYEMQYARKKRGVINRGNMGL